MFVRDVFIAAASSAPPRRSSSASARHGVGPGARIEERDQLLLELLKIQSEPGSAPPLLEQCERALCEAGVFSVRIVTHQRGEHSLGVTLGPFLARGELLGGGQRIEAERLALAQQALVLGMI